MVPPPSQYALRLAAIVPAWNEAATVGPVVRALREGGAERVLVVDGGGSLRCALLGDRLAELGRSNGWAGIVIYGAVRDSDVLKGIAFGVKALNTNPRKSVKRQEGQRDLTVTFGGVDFLPGDYLYADSDGVLVCPERLFNDDNSRANH